MREQMFESGDSGGLSSKEVNLTPYLQTVRRLWARYLLLGAIAGLVFYGYKSYTLPPPKSIMRLSIGFDSISQKVYPDGAHFSKGDLISSSVLQQVRNTVPELAASKTWVESRLASSMTVEEVFPVDLQLIKEQLQQKGSNLKPDETIVLYNKLLRFSPSQFDIVFAPNPTFSEGMREKILDAIAKEYANQTIQKHMIMPQADTYSGGDLDKNTPPWMVLNYLANKVDQAEEIIGALESHNLRLENGEHEDASASNSLYAKNLMETSQLSAQQLAHLSRLNDIKVQLKVIEDLIFVQQAVPDAAMLRKNIEWRISELEEIADALATRSEVRLQLAKLPTSFTGSSGKGQENDPPLMGLLLSFNPQYYSLMNEVKVLSNDYAKVKRELFQSKNWLRKLDGPDKPGMDRATAINLLEEKEKSALSMMAALSSNLIAEMGEKLMGKQPPISSHVITHNSSRVSLGTPVVFGFVMMISTLFLHMLYLILTGKVTAKVNERDSNPSLVFGAKVLGKTY